MHVGAAGTNGPARIDFSGQLNGSTIDPDVSLVAADPTEWNVNVHTGTFPAGAIRGQIPEPGTLVLVGGGVAWIAGRRARR